jgi:hypothetical protein
VAGGLSRPRSRSGAGSPPPPSPPSKPSPSIERYDRRRAGERSPALLLWALTTAAQTRTHVAAASKPQGLLYDGCCVGSGVLMTGIEKKLSVASAILIVLAYFAGSFALAFDPTGARLGDIGAIISCSTILLGLPFAGAAVASLAAVRISNRVLLQIFAAVTAGMILSLLLSAGSIAITLLFAKLLGGELDLELSALMEIVCGAASLIVPLVAAPALVVGMRRTNPRFRTSQAP